MSAQTAEPVVSGCIHCGVAIVSQDGIRWGHKSGPGSIVIRCNPRDSGKPYGLDATPTGASDD